MDIHFAYGEEDAGLLGADLGHLPSFRDVVDRRWIFSFQVYPQESGIVVTSVQLKCDANSFPITEISGNLLTRLTLDSRGFVAGRSALRISRQGPQIPAGSLYAYVPEGPFAGFPALMRTRFVHAHRVVRPNLTLQALDTLGETADTMGPFLDTMLSNKRETFSAVERVVTDVFPEFKFVNPEKSQNGVTVTLTRRDSNESIPLTHCGTGVEQVLAIAAFVLDSAPGTILLLDEPHS
jgi:hypothetical protein